MMPMGMMNNFDDGPDRYDGQFGSHPSHRPAYPTHNAMGGGPGGGGHGMGPPNMGGMDPFGGGGKGKGKGKGRNQRGDEQDMMRELGGGMPPQLGGGMPGMQLGGGMPDSNATPPAGWSNVTTIMMRNLPNKYTQRMLLTEVNQIGFLGTFDFLYLPIDPETSANRGYAFLNFIDPSFAWMFRMSYEGRKMNRFNSSKVVSVMPATLQGFDANYAHYSTARVNRGDPAARPLFLREPTQQVRSKGAPKRSGGGGGNAGMGAGGGGNRRKGGNDNPMPAEMTAAPDGMQNPWQQDDNAGGPPRPSRDGAPGGGERSMVPKFCPHCGGSVQGHFQFCPHCGSSVDFSALTLPE